MSEVEMEDANKPTRLNWFIFALLAFLSVILTVILLVMTVRKWVEIESLASQNEEPAVVTEYTDDEIDEILNSVQLHLYSLNGEQEIQSYMNDKINEYSGTNVEIRLIFMKAWIYVGNKQFGLALNIAESIDENSLSDENKMRYYLIMMEIYNKMGNDTLKKEYTEKYRQLYKAMFKDADKEPEDDETINNEDNENGGMYEN